MRPLRIRPKRHWLVTHGRKRSRLALGHESNPAKAYNQHGARDTPCQYTVKLIPGGYQTPFG